MQLAALLSCDWCRVVRISWESPIHTYSSVGRCLMASFK